MITAINTANKNNNVNFKGMGQIEKFPLALDKKLITKFRDVTLTFAERNTIIHDNVDSNLFLKFWSVISDELGGSIKSVVKPFYKKLDLEETNKGFFSLRKACFHAEPLRDNYKASVVAPKSWLDGTTYEEIGDFASELKEFLIKKGITDKNGVFIGLPAKSATITDGTEFLPDNLRDIAGQINLFGGSFKNPVFRSVTVDGIDNPYLNINAANATIRNSQIGRVYAGKTDAISSTFNGDVFTNQINLQGKNKIEGNLGSKRFVTCFTNSQVRINGDVHSSKFSVLPESQVVINGRLGTEDKPICEIMVDHGSLRTKEAHANTLDTQVQGKFETDVLDIKNLPLKIKLKYFLKSIGVKSPLF